MTQADDSIGLAPPGRLEVLDENEAAPPAPAMDTTAVVVFHGMGQQVKFETLDLLAQTLVDQHEAGRGRTAKRVRHVWSQDRDGGRFLPRVEVELQDPQGNAMKSVHLYEAYWAPLTEGAIGFYATALFFLGAGWRGIWAILKDGNKFLRWAFGREREFPLAPGTFLSLVLATVLLVALVVVLTVGAYWVWPAELRETMSLDALLKAGFSVVLAALAFYVIWKVRRWIVQYLGDVAIYLGSSDLDRYWRIREEIKRRVLPRRQRRLSSRYAR